MKKEKDKKPFFRCITFFFWTKFRQVIRESPKVKEIAEPGGGKQADNKININLAPSTNESSEWRAAETMISLLGATKYTAENANKPRLNFRGTTKSLFIFWMNSKKAFNLWWILRDPI